MSSDTESCLSFGLQQQSTLRIGRTEARIHLIWLSQIGSVFRRTQKPVRQQGVPTLLDLSPRGSKDTHGVHPQPSLAVCVRRRCPNRGVATGRYLPMRHRTNPDNFTKETDASMHHWYIAEVSAPQRFSDFIHFWISMETKWKLLNLPMGKLYLFLKGFLNYE